MNEWMIESCISDWVFLMYWNKNENPINCQVAKKAIATQVFILLCFFLWLRRFNVHSLLDYFLKPHPHLVDPPLERTSSSSSLRKIRNIHWMLHKQSWSDYLYDLFSRRLVLPLQSPKHSSDSHPLPVAPFPHRQVIPLLYPSKSKIPATLPIPSFLNPNYKRTKHRIDLQHGLEVSDQEARPWWDRDLNRRI